MTIKKFMKFLNENTDYSDLAAMVSDSTVVNTGSKDGATRQ